MSTLPTRQRSNSQLSGNDLPKRRGKALQTVSKPLQNTSLKTVIYWLAAAAVLMSTFYAYRITRWKADAGGWWNLAIGKRPSQMHAQNYGGSVPSSTARSKNLDLEDHINGIASILAIHPTDLASAISGVVAEHVAPKSLSSLSSSASAASAEKTAVDALFGGDGESNRAEGHSGGPSLGSVAKAVEALVGFDEPVGADAL